MIQKSKCDFIEAPLFEGSTCEGTNLAYSVVKQNSANRLKGTFCDYKEHVKVNGLKSDHKIKNIDIVVTKCENIRLSTIKTFQNGRFPIVIGGDHSTAIGSIAAVSEMYGIENFAVTYIDAHADINTEATSTSHNIHGMPLAACLGICSKNLNVGSSNKKIFGDNLFIIGARSIDKPEYKIIKENGVHLYKSEALSDRKIENVYSSLVENIGNKKVHVSFDVDVLDPSYFKSTGYNVKDGISVEKIKNIFDFIFDNFDVASIDVVEYNPLLDHERTDLKTLVSLIEYIENLVCQKQLKA
ncbi:MAG: arginase [Bacilli bacterium]|nr:arginase [Bacilli bacterium]